jgi:hypothetical protein
MAEETTYKIEYAKCVWAIDGAGCDLSRVQVTSQQASSGLCLQEWQGSLQGTQGAM